MELPQTKKPSPLSPHFFYKYVKFGVPALAITVAVLALNAYGYLGVLPFTPLYLLVLTLPFIGKMLQAELERHRHEYVFNPERVKVRTGRHTIQQEDVLYEEITDISSERPTWEQLVDVGDLFLHLTGTDKVVSIIGLRHPDRYEDLMLGREPAEQHEETDIESLQEQLQELEQEYENGEIGRAEYERRYYYLQGKLDVLEEQG